MFPIKRGIVRGYLESARHEPSKYLETRYHDNFISMDANQLLDLFTEASYEMQMVIEEIQDESLNLQGMASVADDALCRKLDYHSENLEVVNDVICKIISNFEKTSTGALRISDRLAQAESERARIQRAQELLNYIKLLQATPLSLFKQLENMTGDELHVHLPCDFPSKSWGEICQILHSLTRILGDITTDDADMAQRSAQLLSDIVETELLAQFEGVVVDLMAEPDAVAPAARARDLASWLFLFNGGAHIQRRFVFGIVQSRVPEEISEFGKAAPSSPLRIQQPIKLQQPKKGLGLEMTFGFGSKPKKPIEALKKGNLQSETINVLTTNTNSMDASTAADNSDQVDSLQDHLSQLFGGINALCVEQSKVISLIFPSHAIGKITRQLLLRIFNDPAFGLQANIDLILRPRRPRPPLPPADYLDMLATVREKLCALESILVDCFGSEASSGNTGLNNDLYNSDRAAPSSSRKEPSESQNSVGVETKSNVDLEALSPATNPSPDGEKRFADSTHLRPFIEEQVSQLLSQYQADYFEREMSLVRQRFSESLLQATGDSGFIIGSIASSSLVRLRHDRIKYVQQISKAGGIGTKGYINRVLGYAEDAMARMKVVAKEDKKTPIRAKDLYILLQVFLVDHTLLPMTIALNGVLGRVASSSHLLATVQSTASGQQPQPLPIDFVTVIASIYYGITNIKRSFRVNFANIIGAVPHALLICKEMRKKGLTVLGDAAKDACRAWAWAQVSHYEHLLSLLQNKVDFKPKSSLSAEAMGSPEPTAACLAVCTAIKRALRDLLNEDINTNIGEAIWTPLAELFVAALITHIRRQKISSEGALILVLDLDEYRKALDPTNFTIEDPESGKPQQQQQQQQQRPSLVNGIKTAGMNGTDAGVTEAKNVIPKEVSCPSVKDLMLSLREACFVFMVPSTDVPKVVTEDLRHIDAALVVGLLCARDDYTTRSGAPWAKQINASFPSLSVSGQLSWERRFPNQLPQGPKSLRMGGHYGQGNVYTAGISAGGISQQTSSFGSSLLIEPVRLPLEEEEEEDVSEDDDMDWLMIEDEFDAEDEGVLLEGLTNDRVNLDSSQYQNISKIREIKPNYSQTRDKDKLDSSELKVKRDLSAPNFNIRRPNLSKQTTAVKNTMKSFFAPKTKL